MFYNFTFVYCCSLCVGRYGVIRLYFASGNDFRNCKHSFYFNGETVLKANTRRYHDVSNLTCNHGDKWADDGGDVEVSVYCSFFVIFFAKFRHVHFS